MQSKLVLGTVRAVVERAVELGIRHDHDERRVALQESVELAHGFVRPEGVLERVRGVDDVEGRGGKRDRVQVGFEHLEADLARERDLRRVELDADDRSEAH
eukprot:2672784-Rhodomonas_salina.1